MREYLIAAAWIGGTSALLWAGMYFGGRWVDRMLCVQPPIDPNKPIVRPKSEPPTT